MAIVEDIVSDFKETTDTAIEALRHDLSRLRTGRASISILDGVRVDYYGTATPLSQCANLTVADARMITVKPWDRGIIGAIERAIQQADIGIMPQNDGDTIRLPVPALTEERRRDLVKQAKARGEEAKISVRSHRRDANDMLKESEKEKEISQDELKKGLEKIQEATDKAIKLVDEVLVGKEKEILEI